jgi:hypothetical protein
MRWTFAILAGCFLVLPCRGQFPFPNACDPTVGGWAIFRDRNQTICSVGGVFCPRKVTVTEKTPQGPVVSQAVYPSWLKDPTVASRPVPLPSPRPPAATARLQVQLPDPRGLLYLGERLLPSEGTVRWLESPPLEPGKVYPLRLRAAFKVGDNLLIEERELSLQAGASVVVIFEGKTAIAVPLPSKDRQAL